MVSLPVVVLSMLVLALSGGVAVLSVRLHRLQKKLAGPCPTPVQGGSAQAGTLGKRRERAAQLSIEIKRALTHVCATIPSAIPGLSIERIYLLCSGELKDKAAAVSNTLGNGFSDRLLQGMDGHDFKLLDEYIDRLSAIAEEIKDIDLTLAPVFKAWSGGSTAVFDGYEQRLAAVALQLDELQTAAQALLHSAAARGETGAVLSVPERIRKASSAVNDPNVRAAMNDLELLARRHYDALDRQTKARVESYYLDTLELVTGELKRAEQAGENTGRRAQLCVRVIRVLCNIITAGQLARREISDRNLEAEVAALERLAAVRGDTAKGTDSVL